MTLLLALNLRLDPFSLCGDPNLLNSFVFPIVDIAVINYERGLLIKLNTMELVKHFPARKYNHLVFYIAFNKCFINSVLLTLNFLVSLILIVYIFWLTSQRHQIKVNVFSFFESLYLLKVSLFLCLLIWFNDLIVWTIFLFNMRIWL